MTTYDASMFSLDRVRQIIADNQKSEYVDRVGPPIAFLPEGRHIIRWFFDPTGELYRELTIGRVGKNRFLCPDFCARHDRFGEYPECRICRESNERDRWKDRCRYNCMIYGYVYETKAANDYWQPGNVYAILGNSRLRRALLETLETFVDDGADMLMAMLTPTVKGYVSSTTVTKGQQGHVTIQMLTKTVDPISLDDWYIPLGDVYISNAFDEDAYDAAVEEYLESLENEVENKAADGTNMEEQQNIVPNNSTSKDASSNGTSKPSSAQSFFDTVADDVAKQVDEVFEEEDDEEEEEVVVKKTTTKTRAKKTPKKEKVFDVSLPEGVTEDMLPEECLGWGNHDSTFPVCIMCDFSIDCMSVGEAG
jgi:hypothetical protein